MLESSAKVTTKSVIAEQIYPIMTPLMTNMDILWTFFATRRTNPMEIIDPMKAAIIIAADPIEIDLLRKKIILFMRGRKPVRILEMSISITVRQ